MAYNPDFITVYDGETPEPLWEVDLSWVGTPVIERHEMMMLRTFLESITAGSSELIDLIDAALQSAPLPPPSAADRVLSPGGMCLEFGCDCEDGRHHE